MRSHVPLNLAHGSVSNTATAYATAPACRPVIRSRPHTISFTLTSGPVRGPVLIPAGEGASATPPGAGPGLAAAGAGALAAGTLLLIRRGTRRRRVTCSAR